MAFSPSTSKAFAAPNLGERRVRAKAVAGAVHFAHRPRGCGKEREP